MRELLRPRTVMSRLSCRPSWDAWNVLLGRSMAEFVVFLRRARVFLLPVRDVAVRLGGLTVPAVSLLMSRLFEMRTSVVEGMVKSRVIVESE